MEQEQLDVGGMGNFIRVKASLDANVRLEGFVTVSIAGKWEFYQVKYEKISKFCAASSLIGHMHEESVKGEHAEKDLKWGDWFKDDKKTWCGHTHGYRFPGRGRAPGMRDCRAEFGLGRSDPGMGRGRGDYVDWRNHPEHA